MKPDLDAIRARCEAAQVIFARSSVVAPCVYDDIPALLAYIDELERLNGVNSRIIVGLLSTIESMSTVDASYDDDEP